MPEPKKKEKTVGRVTAIFIAPEAGAPMQSIQKGHVIIGLGLEGDRYTSGTGSWNRKKGGKGYRQLAFINGSTFEGTDFEPSDSRRGVVVEGENLELPEFILKRFRIGTAVFKGFKYCTVCPRPSSIGRKIPGFRKVFCERGGILVKVVKTGDFKVGDEMIEIESHWYSGIGDWFRALRLPRISLKRRKKS